MNISFQWLFIVSVTVFYNLIFVVGRATFWEMQYAMPATWFLLDYLADATYLVDSFVRAHEGSSSES
jgi:hypothetical protein